MLALHGIMNIESEVSKMEEKWEVEWVDKFDMIHQYEYNARELEEIRKYAKFVIDVEYIGWRKK